MTPDSLDQYDDADEFTDDQHEADEPQGNSQEVFQAGHHRTVTERPHTFTCSTCARTFSIMQYPAPSRRVCDECKQSETAKQSKADYMRVYMAEKRAADRARAMQNGQDVPRRGRPRKQA